MGDVAVEPQQEDWGAHYQARRTKALPKHTLFGSVLEQLDDQDRAEMQRIAASGYVPPAQRKQKPRFSLPESVKSKLPGREQIELQCQQIKAQKQALINARDNLKDIKVKALSFQTDDVTVVNPRRDRATRKEYQRYTRNDIEHADEMNKVGLNNTTNYNRDKHGRRLSGYRSAIIGDIVQYDRNVGTGHHGQYSPSFGTVHDYRRKMAQLVSDSTNNPTQQYKSVVELPLNIRHSYGSQECDNLLSDKDKVDRTVEEQKKTKLAMMKYRRQSTLPELRRPDINPTYEAFGNAIRSNVFPGYTMNHTSSLMKEDHSIEVFLARQPPPDTFRHQRDELGMWTEHHILRERMKKQWDEYADATLKASVNWDRGAKRVVPEKTEIKQKPKKSMKNKPMKKQQTKVDAIEEVQFKTPPLTPIQSNSPEKFPEYSKDEEFWKLYDN